MEAWPGRAAPAASSCRTNAAYGVGGGSASFDGRRSSGREASPVGVLLDNALGTMIGGCRFEGHGAYPIYATANSQGTTILGNSFPPGAVMWGDPDEPTNYDVRLGAVHVIRG